MEDVLKLAEKISDILSTSDVYLEYERSYNRIKNNNEIMDRIKKIKREHVDFAQDYMRGNCNFDREKYLSQEFYKLMLDKDVETYFMNEHKLVQLLNGVYDKILDRCRLQIFE